MGNACCQSTNRDLQTDTKEIAVKAVSNLEEYAKQDNNGVSSSTKDNIHAPSEPESVYSPDLMDRINDAFAKIRSSSDGINEIPSRAEFKDLPTLGPYDETSKNTLYYGKYKNGMKEGVGILVWPETNIYYGEFKDNQVSGKGIMLYEDGSTYTGDWLNDKAHGEGKFSDQDGVTYEGAWEKDYR